MLVRPASHVEVRDCQLDEVLRGKSCSALTLQSGALVCSTATPTDPCNAASTRDGLWQVRGWVDPSSPRGRFSHPRWSWQWQQQPWWAHKCIVSLLASPAPSAGVMAQTARLSFSLVPVKRHACRFTATRTPRQTQHDGTRVMLRRLRRREPISAPRSHWQAFRLERRRWRGSI
jgi:hypothetical protein